MRCASRSPSPSKLASEDSISSIYFFFGVLGGGEKKKDDEGEKKKDDEGEGGARWLSLPLSFSMRKKPALYLPQRRLDRVFQQLPRFRRSSCCCVRGGRLGRRHALGEKKTKWIFVFSSLCDAFFEIDFLMQRSKEQKRVSSVGSLFGPLLGISAALESKKRTSSSRCEGER